MILQCTYLLGACTNVLVCNACEIDCMPHSTHTLVIVEFEIYTLMSMHKVM